MKAASMVNLAQIHTIDKGRLKERLGVMGAESMQEVDQALCVSLALER